MEILRQPIFIFFFFQQSGEQTEERESLAQKAAEAMHVGTDGEELMDGEAIDKYNKGMVRKMLLFNHVPMC